MKLTVKRLCVMASALAACPWAIATARGRDDLNEVPKPLPIQRLVSVEGPLGPGVVTTATGQPATWEEVLKAAGCGLPGAGEPTWIALLAADADTSNDIPAGKRIHEVVATCPPDQMIPLIIDPSNDVTHQPAQVEALEALIEAAAGAAPTTVSASTSTLPSATTIPKATTTAVPEATVVHSTLAPSTSQAATPTAPGVVDDTRNDSRPITTGAGNSIGPAGSGSSRDSAALWFVLAGIAAGAACCGVWLRARGRTRRRPDSRTSEFPPPTTPLTRNEEGKHECRGGTTIIAGPGPQQDAGESVLANPNTVLVQPIADRPLPVAPAGMQSPGAAAPLTQISGEAAMDFDYSGLVRLTDGSFVECRSAVGRVTRGDEVTLELSSAGWTAIQRLPRPGG